MDRNRGEISVCPSCETINIASDILCTGCGETMLIVIPSGPRYRRLSLGSIMVVIAVVAVCLAFVREAPFLCVPLAALMVPATSRWAFIIDRRSLEHRPLSAMQKFLVFIECVLVNFVILIAGTGTFFFAVCLGVPLVSAQAPWNWGFVVFILAGIIAALAVSYFVLKWLGSSRNWL